MARCERSVEGNIARYERSVKGNIARCERSVEGNFERCEHSVECLLHVPNEHTWYVTLIMCVTITRKYDECFAIEY